MRVVHDGPLGEVELAGDVEVADSVLARARGLMFRSDLPSALVFRFGTPGRRSVHMLFVRHPLDVLWLLDDEVQRRETLSPWTGYAVGRADTLVELPAGAADDVTEGDRVRVEGRSD